MYCFKKSGSILNVFRMEKGQMCELDLFNLMEALNCRRGSEENLAPLLYSAAPSLWFSSPRFPNLDPHIRSSRSRIVILVAFPGSSIGLCTAPTPNSVLSFPFTVFLRSFSLLQTCLAGVFGLIFIGMNVGIISTADCLAATK